MQHTYAETAYLQCLWSCYKTAPSIIKKWFKIEFSCTQISSSNVFKFRPNSLTTTNHTLTRIIGSDWVRLHSRLTEFKRNSKSFDCFPGNTTRYSERVVNRISHNTEISTRARHIALSHTSQFLSFSGNKSYLKLYRVNKECLFSLNVNHLNLITFLPV